MKITVCKAYYKKQLLVIAALITAMVCAHFSVSVSGETAVETLYGREDALFVVENLKYTDIAGSWAENEILKAGALGVLKGYGSRFFSPSSHLTKEEALALAYRMAGREEEAQKEGERLNLMRRPDERKTSPLDVWHDGYLQLAFNDGLIGRQDLQDALRPDQERVGVEGFHRNDPVLRQEFAYWLAMALDVEPVYVQEAVFNSFNDWSSADTEKIPWIEAVLRKGIMASDDNGYFRPDGSVDRKLAALVVCNFPEEMFQVRGMGIAYGTVEAVSFAERLKGTKNISVKTYHVRNSDGTLHDLVVDDEHEIVVIKDGSAKDSRGIEEGDRLEYVFSSPDEEGAAGIVYAEVISSVDDTKYMAAKLVRIDTQQRLVRVRQYFELDFPHIGPGDKFDFEMDPGKSEALYRYRMGVPDDLSPGDSIILTIRSGIVIEMKKVEFPFTPAPGTVVGGIVEENNPSLGYITLYNEDGTGISPENLENMILFRTFSYPAGGRIEVLKNHMDAAAEDVKQGDTVFIRLDSEGCIDSISAADNYTIRRGRVMARTDNTIMIEYESGVEQLLELSPDTIITLEGAVVDARMLEEGDYVELTLNITSGGTNVRRISVKNSGKLVTTLYKGVFAGVDSFSRSISLYNVEKLQGINWTRVEQTGVVNLRLCEECAFHADDKMLSLEDISSQYKGNRVYMALREGYGNEEEVKEVLFIDDGPETVFSDKVVFTSTSGLIRLASGHPYLYCVSGTIAVSKGRLVNPGSIARGELVWVVANRDLQTGRYNVALISTIENVGMGDLEISRGRIAKIEENEKFIVESFSRLQETGWSYSNTPKTFNILHSTRIVSSEGVENIRNFKGYGENNRIGDIVYIVSDGINARLISDMDYGEFLTRGKIVGVENGTIYVRDARNYDEGEFMWEEADDMDFDTAPNTIVVRNGELVSEDELVTGDSVTILRKDGLSRDAFVVIVQRGF